MAGTDHLIAPEELMAYLDGELSPDRAAIAAVHLEQCRECQDIAADLQGVSRRLTAWQVDAPGNLAPDRLSFAIEENRHMEVKRARKNLFRYGAVGLAAGVVILSTLAIPRLDKSRMSADMARTREPHTAMFMAPAPQHYARDSAAESPASQGRLPSSFAVSTIGRVPLAQARLLHTPAGSMIVRTSQLTLTTTTFDIVRDRIMVVLGRHKGYVSQLNISAPAGSARTLEAALRVPGDQLESVTTELKALGRVELESQNGEEVTQQYVDLEARLVNAKNTEQRLADLLRQRTGKLSDVLDVEKEIDEVREKIERMEAEKKSLANRVDFATLNIKVNEDYKAQIQVVPGSFLTRFRNAAVEGYESTVESLLSVLVVLLTYGPTILIWAALLFVPARLAWKKWRRTPSL